MMFSDEKFVKTTYYCPLAATVRHNELSDKLFNRQLSALCQSNNVAVMTIFIAPATNKQIRRKLERPKIIWRNLGGIYLFIDSPP